MAEYDNEVIIDLEIFSEEAVLRACYDFNNIFYFSLVKSNNELHVKYEAHCSDHSIKDIEGGFRNKVIDHQLRIKIEDKTKLIRDTLVYSAMKEAGAY